MIRLLPLLAAWSLVLLAAAAAAAEPDPATAAAITRGQRHLAEQQRADGGWSGAYGDTTGVTALAVLALAAGGDVPGRGEHGAAILRGLRFIAATAQPDGLLYRAGMAGAPMYHHSLGLLALAEFHGELPDEVDVGALLARGVQLLRDTQNGAGGWRYQPILADDDITLTALPLLALEAAADAGAAPAADCATQAIAYLRACRSPGGAFSYRPGGGIGMARTALGLLGLAAAGAPGDELQPSVGALLAWKPVGEEPVVRWSAFGGWAAAWGLRRASRHGTWAADAFRRHHGALAAELVPAQRGDGGWDGTHGLAATAFAVLALAAPLDGLPLLRR